MGFSKKIEWFGFGFLSLFAGIFLMGGSAAAPLIDWDENIYAEASRQMLLRSDYLNIYVNDYPFAEKPPFFLWLQALSFHIFGINEFAARFPSAVAGVACVWFCFFFGRKIHSYPFGTLWAIVYLTSLLPAFFARSGVIDHTFNFLIMLAAYSLYAYDVNFRETIDSRQRGGKGRTWGWLTIASISMGLAVLTKGPVGAVIPLVAFSVYKVFYRYPRLSLLHFLYCALLSLSVALSWYLVNWRVYGVHFIAEFIEFQKALFSRPLEGHRGPFYYHILVALPGLFPWTPFLILFRWKHFPPDQLHARPLLIMGTGWIVFVLVLFGIVTTKLPHYSASIYIPLSFAIALCLERCLQIRSRIPKGVILLYLLMGTIFSALLAFFPFLLETHFERQGVVIDVQSPWQIHGTGIALFSGVSVASWFLWKKKLRVPIWITVASMFVVTQGIWRFHAPVYLRYTQQPLIEMVQSAYAQQGKVVLYRYVSFAALFYGKQPIEMLHTYKFPGNPEILDNPQEGALFVITERKNKKKLKKEHPLVEFVRDSGTFSLFILPRSKEKSS